MNDITIINESGGVPVREGNRWLVTVARPGQGSSGFYPEKVLKETGPSALPAGTKAFFNHDAKRDVRDMVGTYDDGAFWNDEEGELQAYLTPFPRYRNVLEEAGTNVEASIHCASRSDKRTGNVTELVFHRANTVDLVSFAGLEGSGLKQQVESLFAAASAEAEEEKKEHNVEISKEMWDAQASAVATIAAKFDTFIAESKAEVKGVADEAALEAAVSERVEEALKSISDIDKSVDAAEIPAVLKESLKADAHAGKDITDALAQAVSIVAEAKKEFAPTHKPGVRGNVVVVNESLDQEPQSFRVGQWS